MTDPDADDAPELTDAWFEQAERRGATAPQAQAGRAARLAALVLLIGSLIAGFGRALGTSVSRIVSSAR